MKDATGREIVSPLDMTAEQIDGGHLIATDTTATGHARLNCSCGKSVVRQPWMTDGVWRSRVRMFERFNHGENTVVRGAAPSAGPRTPPPTGSEVLR